jgi:3-deoxy-D-manno-octulosonic-acid transferase
MYALYVTLTLLVVPFFIVADAWHECRQRALRGRLRQRLGWIEPVTQPGCVWLHAVSVGEVQAASGLVNALRNRVPGAEIVLTTVTTTGAETARAVFGDRVRHRYLPYDTPGAVRRFLARLEPAVAVMLETEIWPTLYFALKKRGIPIVLASARLSERSVRRYVRFGSLGSRLLANGVTVCAQSAADAERFVAVGAARERVHVTGNVKFDLEIPAATIEAGRQRRAEWGGDSRPVWIAGSTREGEETAALDAQRDVQRRHMRALLVLVPRHPPRFDEVRELLRQRSVRFSSRSEGRWPQPDDEVLLVDTLGELQMLYAASDVAFVGGSLVPIGGHNLLEPASLGMAVVAGPHLENTLAVAERLRAARALRIVHDARELADAVTALLDDAVERGAMGRRALEVVAGSRGAVERGVSVIEPLVPVRAAPRVGARSASRQRGSG